ncbi:unnamed protein product [Linum trigynum]|uniref:Uncharacterized protein n=1 Tax=Linum trigynum TaxID=586398 RepID=A0AAV2EII7_9ROSI
MVVFSLNSDKQFIQTHHPSPYIHVYEYKGDPNVFEMIHAQDSSFRLPPTRIAVPLPPLRGAVTEFDELEVFGVTIRGNQLVQLFNDLTLTHANGKTFPLLVNRQGLCFLEVGGQPVRRLRINDHFGWSKYGVAPRICTIWSIWDMNNGAVLVAPPVEEDGCESMLRKMLEERDKEVAALKTAMKALCHE